MPLKGVYCEDPTLQVPTPIDWADCLNCAATWGNPCSLPYPLLRAIKEDAETPHAFPSVTSLTGCLRKAWLTKTRDYYEYPSGRVALLFGTWLHELLEGNGNGALAEIKVQYTTEGGVVVRGTADLYVPSLKGLRDWKSAAALYVNRLPYGHHERQVNLYAFMLARNELEPRLEVENLGVIYVCKTGPDKKKGAHNGVLQVPIEKWDPERTQTFIHKRAWALDQAMKGNAIPYRTRDKWACNYCPVVNLCEGLRE